jgi:hypothetical protein
METKADVQERERERERTVSGKGDKRKDCTSYLLTN